MGKALFDKIWDSHVITELGNGIILMHIDRRRCTTSWAASR